MDTTTLAVVFLLGRMAGAGLGMAVMAMLGAASRADAAMARADEWEDL